METTMGQFVVVKKFAINHKNGAGQRLVVGTVGQTVDLPTDVADAMPSYVVPAGTPAAAAVLAGESPEARTAVHDLSIAEIAEAAGALETTEQLDELEAAEKRNPKFAGGRIGALRAIAARRAQVLGV